MDLLLTTTSIVPTSQCRPATPSDSRPVSGVISNKAHVRTCVCTRAINTHTHTLARLLLQQSSSTVVYNLSSASPHPVQTSISPGYRRKAAVSNPPPLELVCLACNTCMTLTLSQPELALTHAPRCATPRGRSDNPNRSAEPESVHFPKSMSEVARDNDKRRHHHSSSSSSSPIPSWRSVLSGLLPGVDAESLQPFHQISHVGDESLDAALAMSTRSALVSLDRLDEDSNVLLGGKLHCGIDESEITSQPVHAASKRIPDLSVQHEATTHTPPAIVADDHARFNRLFPVFAKPDASVSRPLSPQVSGMIGDTQGTHSSRPVSAVTHFSGFQNSFKTFDPPAHIMLNSEHLASSSQLGDPFDTDALFFGSRPASRRNSPTSSPRPASRHRGSPRHAGAPVHNDMAEELLSPTQTEFINSPLTQNTHALHRADCLPVHSRAAHRSLSSSLMPPNAHDPSPGDNDEADAPISFSALYTTTQASKSPKCSKCGSYLDGDNILYEGVMSGDGTCVACGRRLDRDARKKPRVEPVPTAVSVSYLFASDLLKFI